MIRKIALDKSGIVSGKPLPFSVFDPGRNILLAAKGQIVTDGMLDALLRNGLMALTDEDDGHGGSHAANPASARRCSNCDCNTRALPPSPAPVSASRAMSAANYVVLQ